VLFIEEKPSIERQLRRGLAIKEQNKRLFERGLPQLEERDTDNFEESARKRYKIFRDHYSTLQSLKKHFPYTMIDASGSIEEVQQNIIKEFKYQSSLELSQESYDMVQRIPLVSDVIVHARGELVSRLDDYQFRNPKLFEEVITMVEKEFVPVIRRHAIAGLATSVLRARYSDGALQLRWFLTFCQKGVTMSCLTCGLWPFPILSGTARL